MRQTFGDLAGLISLVSLGERELFSLLSFFCYQQGWCYRMCLVRAEADDVTVAGGVNLMSALTSTSILSVNTKREERRTSYKTSLDRLSH